MQILWHSLPRAFFGAHLWFKVHIADLHQDLLVLERLPPPALDGVDGGKYAPERWISAWTAE